MAAMLKIETPESCADCPVSREVYVGGKLCEYRYSCPLVGRHGGDAGRHPDCPLVIAPETPEGELKPCPFCGGEAVRVASSKSTSLEKVICTDCDAKTRWRNDREAAIAAWNRRVR